MEFLSKSSCHQTRLFINVNVSYYHDIILDNVPMNVCITYPKYVIKVANLIFYADIHKIINENITLETTTDT